jgi:MOSC domain-containing protein YiiM
LSIYNFTPKDPTTRVLAICAGRQKGQPKRNVGQGQLLKNFGLSGDCDTGPNSNQLLLVSLNDWTRQKDQKPDLVYGALGENLVVSLDLTHLPSGTRLRSGDALMELTQADPPFYAAKVILAGIVTEGDPIIIE